MLLQFCRHTRLTAFHFIMLNNSVWVSAKLISGLNHVFLLELTTFLMD